MLPGAVHTQKKIQETGWIKIKEQNCGIEIYIERLVGKKKGIICRVSHQNLYSRQILVLSQEG
jgi:hypothetical protein